jgi:GcrA cell cycle regulator
MSWANEQHVEMLKSLWTEGKSASQISYSLNRAFPDASYSRNAVIGKVHRLGLSGRATPSKPQRTVHRTLAAPKPAKPQMPRGVGFVLPPLRGAGSGPAVKPAAPVVVVPFAKRLEELPGTATVLTLGAHMCKWPIGDPALDSFRHCGQGQRAGSPYCDHHHARAYAPVPAGRPRTGNELQRSLRRYV